MICEPGHCIHWTMNTEKGASEFLMTPWIVFCQNLQTRLVLIELDLYAAISEVENEARLSAHFRKEKNTHTLLESWTR